MLKEKFSVKYNNTKLIGDIIPAGGKPKLLMLHGAGGSNRSRYDLLRELLMKKGVSTAMFDFIGHGETAGDLAQSSLQDRTNQALAVIKHLGLEEMNIFGSSMGGYIAIKLLEFYPVRTLILAAPAVYDSAAYDLFFDKGFTNVIRNRINSDAWDILAKFTGSLLLYYGDKDEVIPKEITDKIWESAIQAKKEKLVFPNVEHRINLYMQSHPEDLEKIINKITEIL